MTGCYSAVTVVSGGLDSVTMAYRLASEGYAVHALSFDYGQRHKRELDAARDCLRGVAARHDIIDLPLGRLLPSALTGKGDIPDGHYAAASMAATVVPNRNAIFLAIAYGVAVAEAAQVVGVGVHAGDHHIYPDCRPEFLAAFEDMEALATGARVPLYAPFAHWSKADIVAEAARLSVPLSLTWSCYRGGLEHCGRCGTCIERREAFHLAGITDPTIYEE